eukprot:5588258-Lingulodinium_polyedra.AAC.1
MTRKPPPPGLPAGLEAWTGPASPGPACAGSAPAALALGPEPLAARSYADVRSPPPPVEPWDAAGGPHAA